MIITLILIVLIFCILIIRKKNMDIENILSDKINFNPVPVDHNLSTMPVYIINLPHEYNRRKNMKNLMTKLNFVNYKFVEPVNKYKTLNYMKMNNLDLKVSTMSRTLTSLKIFLSEKSEEFIIFEDDIDIYNFNTNLNNIYNSAKNIDYDLLFFEMCYDICYQIKPINSQLLKLHSPLCNGAILYTRRFVNKFLEWYSNNIKINLKNHAIDGIIFDMCYNGNIKCYGYPYFRQNIEYGSSIETSDRFNKKNTRFDPLCRLI